MEFMTIWQRYSDKFSTRKRLCKAFKKRRYSAKLKRLGTQRRKLKERTKAEVLFNNALTLETMDNFKEQLSYFEAKETKLREKLAKCQLFEDKEIQERET